MVGIHNILSNLRVELDSYYLQMRKKLFSYIHIFLNKILGGQIYLPNHSLDSHQIGKISHESDAPSLSLAKKIAYFFKKSHTNLLNKVNAASRLKELHQIMCSAERTTLKYEDDSIEVPMPFYNEICRKQSNVVHRNGKSATNQHICSEVVELHKSFGSTTSNYMMAFWSPSCMQSFL